MSMNSSNIYIPTKINVGYQNREGTYTGKLAYVIYYDAKGKLRKETSWNNWRDDNIPNDIYENIPTEGFVLNKKVGGVEESYGYDPRKTYTRVYDPRGFEFEITIPNLLWILENCNCVKGKGLEGEFVYGWNGKDLILVPVDSPDYKSITEKSEVINKQEFIKPKDLVVGYTYVGKKPDEEYVYLGRFDYWDEQCAYWDSRKCKYFYYENHDDKEVIDYSTWYSVPWTNTKYRSINKGKHYWFFLIDKDYPSCSGIRHMKNVSNRFISCTDNKISDKLPEYIKKLELEVNYKPIDYSNIKVEQLPLINFDNMMENLRHKRPYNSYYIYNKHYKRYVLSYYNSEYHYYISNSTYTNSTYTLMEHHGSMPIINSIENLYNKFQPIYITLYYIDGTEYKRMGWYDENGNE